jgi:hypothetical protein
VLHSGRLRLERVPRVKHSSLLRKSINYGRNKFYDTGPGSTAELITRVKSFTVMGAEL